jgi:hypothetical protein
MSYGFDQLLPLSDRQRQRLLAVDIQPSLTSQHRSQYMMMVRCCNNYGIQLAFCDHLPVVGICGKLGCRMKLPYLVDPWFIAIADGHDAASGRHVVDQLPASDSRADDTDVNPLIGGDISSVT